jgi:GNAT superfamily N-acetyltransferase
MSGDAALARRSARAVTGMASNPGKPRVLEVVITYLEMTARSNLSVVAPAGVKIAVLRAEQPTISFYRYLYNTVGEPWFWWQRRAMSDDELRIILEDDKVAVFVLYVNGVPAGFAELDRREPPDVALAYFGLVPEFIGRGLGQYFLNTVIGTAWSYEPRRIMVDTCNLDHPKAIQTYQRVGFVPYDQKRVEIEDPRDTGLIPADVPLPND